MMKNTLWWDTIPQLDKQNCRALGRKFDLDNWLSLTTAEKKELVIKLVHFLAKQLKMENTPTVTYGYLKDCDGEFDPNTNTIEIDLTVLEMYGLHTAVTTAHELRHSYQLEKMEKLEQLDPDNIQYITDPVERTIAHWLLGERKEKIKIWKKNDENYIEDDETTFDITKPLDEIIIYEESEYRKQPLEADAFKFEGEFITQFLMD